MLLLLLLICFSRVRLCATPQTAAHQAPVSLGFSRQEHWSGLIHIKQMVTNITPKEFAGQCKKCGFDPWVGKILWRRKWQPTPVFLLGKSPWAEEPGCYSPWECPRKGHDLATKQQLYQRGKNSFMHYHKTEFKIVVAKYQACGWGVEKSRF